MLQFFSNPEVQSYLVAAIVFLMVFCPLWRFAKSICNGIDGRATRAKRYQPLSNSLHYRNRLGED